MPDLIRFGASTWTYPGWQGLVYQKHYKNERDFKSHCLAEYALFPWFRTVGIDSFFYSPPNSGILDRYAAQVPPHFVWVSKVWERITVPRYPQHARYGRLAGSDNPDFLNPDLLYREVLSKFLPSQIKLHCGPFVLQFPPIAAEVLAKLDFLERLAKFLKRLPDELRFAVEIRNRELLTPDYFAVLNEYQAAHCFNHWTAMPPLKEQMRCAAQAGGQKAQFFVARILTPLGVGYQQAVQTFKPYNTILRPIPAMRQDVVRLIARALERKAEAYIIINNRCEGNAPMTIDAIGKMAMAAQGGGGGAS